MAIETITVTGDTGKIGERILGEGAGRDGHTVDCPMRRREDDPTGNHRRAGCIDRNRQRLRAER